jgi:hypothetical protein
VKATYAKKMKDLKQKTRVSNILQKNYVELTSEIMLKESACLVGTLDETKTLRYGQVFLKVQIFYLLLLLLFFISPIC